MLVPAGFSCSFLASLALGCPSIQSAPRSSANSLEGQEAGAKPSVSDLKRKLVTDITRDEIEAHVSFLASDELGGRSTGTPEADRAARYLAHVLASYGVEPAGDGGTFLQNVPLTRSRATKPPEMEIVTDTGEKRALVLGESFDAPRTPIDVRDLLVVVVTSAAEVPKDANARVALFLDAPRRTREEWLAAAGHPAAHGFGLVLAPGSKTPGKAGEFRVRVGGLKRATKTPDRVTATVDLKGLALEAVRARKLVRVSVATHFEFETLTSSNVVGIVRGKGTSAAPDLAREAIVLSAHYDHLAHLEASDKPGADTIFNGADDDASGTSIVLELAGALAKGEAPVRTIVFLLATGEEVGLLGTDEYLDRPPVPLEATILNLNFEMLGRPDELVGGAGSMWLTGFSYTTLGPDLVKAGVKIHDDPRPDEHFFERSDNIAFVRRGIVGQTLSTYNLHTDYHKVTDEAKTLDYAHMEQCAHTALEVVRIAAGGAPRSQWTEAYENAQKKR